MATPPPPPCSTHQLDGVGDVVAEPQQQEQPQQQQPSHLVGSYIVSKYDHEDEEQQHLMPLATPTYTTLEAGARQGRGSETSVVLELSTLE